MEDPLEREEREGEIRTRRGSVLVRFVSLLRLNGEESVTQPPRELWFMHYTC